MTKNEKKILFALARHNDKSFQLLEEDHPEIAKHKLHESIATDSVLMALGIYREYRDTPNEQLDTYVEEVWDQLYR